MRQFRNGPITGINMEPFIDISLVLLIIFIVTAKMIVTPSVPLDLPQATKSEEVQTILSIIITAEGKIFVNGAPIPDEDVLSKLARSYIKQKPDIRVVIAADGSVTHRKVISVLDKLRIAGITRVAFGVSPADINSKEEK